MSSNIDIVFDRKIEGYSPDDRTSLAYVFFNPEFEEIAKNCKATPLTEFYSDEPDSLDYEIDDPVVRKDLKKQMGPAQYFSPAQGIRSIKAICAQLSKKPIEIVRPGRNLREDLLAELDEVEKALELASDQGARFYFKLVQ